MPFQQVAEVNFYYELLGDDSKPPLVLISGYTSDHEAWQVITDKLQDYFYILVFDNQGIGKTKDDGSDLSIDIMAKNTKGLIDALGIENPIIAGFAMGSNIALTIAAMFPADIKQLVLISSLMKWSDHAKQLCERLYILRKQQEMSKYAEVIYNTCFSETYKKVNSKDVVVKNLSSLLVDSQTPEGQRRQLQALMAFDFTARADEKVINVPIIVISPEFDQFATLNEGKELAQSLGGKQISIKDCGHAILNEKSIQLIEIFSNECTFKETCNY